MKKIMMAKGARSIVEINLGVKENEHIAIITEPKQMKIAEALAAAVVAAKAEPSIHILMPRERDGEEPPKTIAAAMKESDGFISAVYTSITHTHAVKNACANGSRGIMLTQFNENQLIKGGVHADYYKAADNCKKVAKALAGAKIIKITTPLGTNLTLSGEGRRGNAMTGLVKAGEFGPVPTVEANVSPVEGSANGIIVADASIPYIGIGLLKTPVKMEVKDGYILPESITGGEEAEKLAKDWISKKDKNVYNVAEIGVGLNPECKFTGSMLEDEGVFGSLHIGVGTNITLGGIIKAPCHYDLIMTKPTLIADEITILKDGELMI